MSSTWTPDLLITRRPDRGLALVAGPWAERTTRLAGVERRFSQGGRGWIVQLPDMDNVDAAAQAERLRVVERKPR